MYVYDVLAFMAYISSEWRYSVLHSEITLWLQENERQQCVFVYITTRASELIHLYPVPSHVCNIQGACGGCERGKLPWFPVINGSLHAWRALYIL